MLSPILEHIDCEIDAEPKYVKNDIIKYMQTATGKVTMFAGVVDEDYAYTVIVSKSQKAFEYSIHNRLREVERGVIYLPYLTGV